MTTNRGYNILYSSIMARGHVSVHLLIYTFVGDKFTLLAVEMFKCLIEPFVEMRCV